MRDLRVLLVEDSAIDAWMVQRGLEGVPCTKVKCVKDGQEAIDYLEGREQYGDRKAFPLPHMILLDLKMPRISGFEFLIWRRDEASDELSMIPVVILSGSDLEEDVKKAYVLGANRYLTKTPDIALFSRRMRQMTEVWTDSELPTRPADKAA